MKLQVNNSCGYWNMERRQHNVAKHTIDKKAHTAINSKRFKNLDYANIALYEVELAKAQVEQKDPIIVGFVLLQFSKL